MRLSELMKPTQKSTNNGLLVFGAHPDDIEFGCGGIIVREAQTGRSVNLVVCSKGEAGTNGTAAQRESESLAAAQLLGVSCQFIEFDGDSKLEFKKTHVLKIAQIIRQLKPAT